MNTKMNKAKADRLSAVVEELARASDNQYKKELVKQALRALQPIPKSEEVTRRLNALLEAYRELPPKMQHKPTGRRTVDRLRDATIQKLNLPDNDDTVSEDTIRKDMQQLGSLLRLVRMGVIPSRLRPHPQLSPCPHLRQKEMDRIRRQHARLGGRNYFGPPTEPKLTLPKAVRRAASRAHELYDEFHKTS